MLLLSIVAPVFTDETASILLAHSVLSASARAACGDHYEILFCDDGSTPEALEALAAAGRSDARVRVLGDGRHRGLGRAVRAGFEAARGEYVLYTDGDGQVGCSELADVWAERGQYDLIIGFREGREEGSVRAGATAALSRVSPHLFGRAFRDVDAAFKLARAEFIRSLPLASRGTGIDAEILLYASRRRARIREIPVRHAPPGARKSRVTPARAAFGCVEFAAAWLRAAAGRPA